MIKPIKSRQVQYTKLVEEYNTDMTVCAAAIYGGSSIFGVSDRMVTAGSIEYERPTPKILEITNSIAVLTAGNTDIQYQIYSIVIGIIHEFIESNPDKWVSVSMVAEVYRDTYIKLRVGDAERHFLHPFKLDMKSYLELQKTLPEDVVSDINFKLLNHKIETVQALIIGIDDSGAHIYKITNDKMSNEDKLGFSAIGIGASHATSHFMLSAYDSTCDEATALLTIHQAKKKAEVAPGVGLETDLCVIGPEKGSYLLVTPSDTIPDIIKDLDTIYKTYTKNIAKINNSAKKSVRTYLNNLTNNSSAQKINEEIQPETSSSNKKQKKTNLK